MVLASLAVVSVTSPVDSSGAGASDWTVYHANAAGTGATTGIQSVNTASPKWRSPALDGALYGEPLVAGGYVYVATENDTVYALSGISGRVVWSRHIAQPVPSSVLPCGNITPSVGITGTPVIDEIGKEIFVVADEFLNGHAVHELVGLNLVNGALESARRVDPPGAHASALLQRTGLTLDRGRVIFGFGGNYGDCAAYRGRVVSIKASSGGPSFFTIDQANANREGAVWMGGAAPVLDAAGHVWVSVGNGSVTSNAQPYDNSDAVLELSVTNRLMQYFAPSSWPQDNASDLDFAMAPVLLANGQVVISGKSRIVYLLNGHHLGGIGHYQTSVNSSCASDVVGGAAVVGSVVYLPCQSGTIAVHVGALSASLRLLWSANAGGGPPIVAAGEVWSIGQDGVLYGLNRANGAVRQRATISIPINHFPTPSVGDGLMLAPGANRVYAFATTPS